MVHYQSKGITRVSYFFSIYIHVYICPHSDERSENSILKFAEYIAKAEKDTFVHDYLHYIEHVVVADESFFGTVLRNTEFCLRHHNFNLLHYSFDR